MADQIHDVDAWVIEQLRRASKTRKPHELAELLGELSGAELTEGTLIMFFARAFRVPLRTLYDAVAWHRFGGELSDEGFDLLIAPHLP